MGGLQGGWVKNWMAHQVQKVVVSSLKEFLPRLLLSNVSTYNLGKGKKCKWYV